jgi:hypothetical protein
MKTFTRRAVPGGYLRVVGPGRSNPAPGDRRPSAGAPRNRRPDFPRDHAGAGSVTRAARRRRPAGGGEGPGPAPAAVRGRHAPPRTPRSSPCPLGRPESLTDAKIPDPCWVRGPFAWSGAAAQVAEQQGGHGQQHSDPSGARTTIVRVCDPVRGPDRPRDGVSAVQMRVWGGWDSNPRPDGL